MTKDQKDVLPNPDSDADQGVQSTSVAGPSVSKRRLIRGGLSAGPVLLALSGKSALAGTTYCQFPSTWASLHPVGGGVGPGISHHPNGNQPGCYGGLSPGYWKQPQKRNDWPAGVVPDHIPGDTNGLFNGGNGNNTCSQFDGTGTKFKDIFSDTSFGSQTFSQLLCSEPGDNSFHYCAAYLNALKYPGSYVLKPLDVIDLWWGRFVVGGQTWTRAQGKAYIDSMYHLGTPTV